MSEIHTQNHVSLQVGSKVTFPAQGKDKQGVIVELRSDVSMREVKYVVRGENGLYSFTRQERVAPAPRPGYPVTWTYHSDLHPATVVSVSKSGLQMTVRDDKYVFAGEPGTGGPGGVDKWDYYPNPLAAERVCKLNKKGMWVSGGAHLIVGDRRYYYDHSF